MSAKCPRCGNSTLRYYPKSNPNDPIEYDGLCDSCLNWSYFPEKTKSNELAEGLYMWFKLYTKQTKKIPDYGRYDFFTMIQKSGVELDEQHKQFLVDYRNKHIID
jgi:hypothetical protein